MAIKRNVDLLLVGSWVTLHMRLSESRQTQKAKHHMIPLRGKVQKRQMHRDRKQIAGWRLTGSGRTRDGLLMAMVFLSRGMEMH